MNRIQKVVALMGFLTCCFIAAAASQTWNPVPSSPAYGSSHLIKAIDFESPMLFTAQKGDLYSSSDNGKSWEKTFGIRGQNARINDIEIFRNNPKLWYALTTNGLFQSSEAGKEWKKIYGGIGERSNNVLSLAQDPLQNEVLYLGSGHGVLISKDGGKSWARAFAELSGKEICDIAADEKNGEIYFASDAGLYRYHAGYDLFRQVFTDSLFVSESEENGTTDNENIENNEKVPSRLTIAFGKQPNPFVAVGTGNGVFVSDDEGETWQHLPNTGFRSAAVTDLAYSSHAQMFFVATPKGIFQYNSREKKWDEIYEGLPNAETFKLAIQLGAREKLVAATKSGIFYYEIESPLFKPEVTLPANRVITEDMFRLFTLEPTVREVQKDAIRYANVDNGKIKRWHLSSRIRSLVPELTFSKNLVLANDIHVDTGSTSTPDFFVQGPDDRRRTTDIDLSWNLADLIWNSAQTSIDSREKLMVELREEILSQVTQLYFERRRMQIDFVSNPPSDPVERMKTLSRIDELTAYLDALTNGRFSKRLKKLYAQHPDLAEFWKLTTEQSPIKNAQSES